MKKVYQADNIQEATLVKDMLERHSILVEIVGAALAGALGELPAFAIGPRILVPEESYEAALKIIQDFEQSKNKSTHGKDWICKSCKETNEPQFSHCWSCGAEKA